LKKMALARGRKWHRVVSVVAFLMGFNLATSSVSQPGSVILRNAARQHRPISTSLLLSAGRDLTVPFDTLRLRGGWGGEQKPAESARKSASTLTWQQHLIAGGVARGTAVGALFPIDSIKTKLQVGQKVSLALPDLWQHFKGFRLALLGQIPYGMVVFGSYETVKGKIFEKHPEWQNSLATKIPVFVACACIGDTLGAIWLTPSEIVKQRLQAGSGTSAVAVIKSVYAQGGMGGFYSGITGLLARDLPYRAMQLPMYEVARELYTEKYCLNRDIQPHEAMILGATVGMLAAALTTPFDVVKSRMMVGSASGKGVSVILKEIYTEAGVRGIFNGAKQRVGYLGLNNAIFFNVYEFARGACSVSSETGKKAPA